MIYTCYMYMYICVVLEYLCIYGYVIYDKWTCMVKINIIRDIMDCMGIDVYE